MPAFCAWDYNSYWTPAQALISALWLACRSNLVKFIFKLGNAHPDMPADLHLDLVHCVLAPVAWKHV